jgi:hypothetical protein
MNTKVLRVDLVSEPDIALAIAKLCDAQVGYRLASSFVWQTSLVLIFQKL